MTTNTLENLTPLPGAEGFIHGAETAPAYWWLDILWIVLADAKETDGRFSLIEQLLPKHSGPHNHTWSDETYYMLDGEIKIARTGDFVIVPRNTRHAFRVDRETARFLNSYTPASLEAAVIEMAMPAPERVLPPKNATPSPAMTHELMRRYGMDGLPGPDPLRPDGH
jgi:mannose-6-phosphate isomerase-like protein (cupin superfamily)